MDAVRKEDLPETELNEWGYPKAEDWEYIGNGLFVRRFEQTTPILSFNGVRMNQEDFLENIRKVALSSLEEDSI